VKGRIWAIGDIHGQLARLEELFQLISLDPDQDELVFMGDYIDRGPDSKGVIDRLLALKKSGLKATFLKGNHEEMFLKDFLTGANPQLYLYNGGLATLKSYAQPGQDPLEARPPAEHMDFLENLNLYYRRGGYLFAHAGLKPGQPLEDQDSHDLLWIREEFFLVSHDWPEKVVFGHTPFREPFRRGKLFGIDTGAAYGGRLTCLVLPDEKFIQA